MPHTAPAGGRHARAVASAAVAMARSSHAEWRPFEIEGVVIGDAFQRYQSE